MLFKVFMFRVYGREGNYQSTRKSFHTHFQNMGSNVALLNNLMDTKISITLCGKHTPSTWPASHASTIYRNCWQLAEEGFLSHMGSQPMKELSECPLEEQGKQYQILFVKRNEARTVSWVP